MYLLLIIHAPVAQLDRVSGYGPEGWGSNPPGRTWDKPLFLEGSLLFGLVCIIVTICESLGI